MHSSDMSCRQIIYTSRPTAEIDDSVLLNILVRSQVKNDDMGISGLLVFHHGQFMQLLEGDADVVGKLMDTIRQDPRHADVAVLLDRESPKRCMPMWAMAFSTSKPMDQTIKEQAFSLSLEEGKSICAAMSGEVGRIFHQFLSD